MFLTRAFLDPTSRAVRADAKNPEGLHKTVMRAFPDDVGPSAPAPRVVYCIGSTKIADGSCFWCRAA